MKKNTALTRKEKKLFLRVFEEWLQHEHRSIYDVYKKPSENKLRIWWNIYDANRDNITELHILSYNTHKFSVWFYDIINEEFIIVYPTKTLKTSREYLLHEYIKTKVQDISRTDES